jgi:SHS2 domain found in N terminus of Rpb7p/Rpc25p/MJ0397
MAVHPAQFGIPTEQALISEINKKYANRVLHDVGLCICVFDLVEVGEGKVRYGDGFLWYKGTRCCEQVPADIMISPISGSQSYSEWSYSDRSHRK